MPTFSDYSDVFDAAQALPTADQIRLIEALWENLSPAEWPAPSEEWIAEAQRRSAAFDAGAMPASPWSEVQVRARQEAGLDD